MPTSKMSPYEQEAVKQIRLWKNPKLTWFDEAMRTINWPLDKAGDAILATPGVGPVLQKTVSGLVSVCNDIAQWSVRSDAIMEAFRNSGHEVYRPKDVWSLDLEHVDKLVGWLDLKYKGIALTEGGASGAAGLLGIPPDIVALITYNFRALGEYATYYGLDIGCQHERLFAMNVLGLASSPTGASKTLAMAQLVRIAKDVAKKKAWRDLEKHAFVKIIQRIAKALGIRLTKAKLAQILPAAGAVVGGGFNVYFTHKVCDAAYFLYRERFLAAKYRNANIIEASVPPAENLEPEYPDDENDSDGCSGVPSRP